MYRTKCSYAVKLLLAISTAKVYSPDMRVYVDFMQNFVDLAGSERASQTNSDGVRLREGCHINLSLMTLTTVIRKLRYVSLTALSLKYDMILINGFHSKKTAPC